MQDEPPKADPPKRCRFQFSLRTLLIVVTLFCVVIGSYVGWQAKIMRSRKAALRRLETVDKGEYWAREPDSWIRRMLGDETVNGIIVPIDTSLEERRSLRAEFPEAEAAWGIVYRVGAAEGRPTKSLSEFSDDPNPR